MKRLYLPLVLSAIFAFGEPPAGIPAQMIVTVGATRGENVPDLSRDHVGIFQGNDRLPITQWTALRGERAGLELFVLIDDTCATPLGGQLDNLRAFVRSLPATTSVGVGYVRNGIAEIAQELTRDRDRAAVALRPPQGNCATKLSPYLGLIDLLGKWPQSNIRHELLLISSGADPANNFGALNPFLEVAMEHAQLGGVIVHTIYSPQPDHVGSFMEINPEQNYLGRLARETGGQSQLWGLSATRSLSVYLATLSEALSHQYSVSFLAKPCDAPTLAPVRFETDLPNVVILAARKVLVWPELPSSIGGN